MTRRADRPTYRVRCQPDGKWWFIEVPELRGVFSQARRLRDVEMMARDAISLMLEVQEDSFDLRVEPSLGPALEKRLATMHKARAEADAARARAAKVTAETAAALVASGLTVRDAGEILGLSFQRVSQLVEAARG